MLTLGVTALLAQTPTISSPFAVYNYDNPVWAPDRYAPSYFGPGNVGGDTTLSIRLSSADGINNRPGAFAFRFYNTQGSQLTAGPVNFTNSTFSISTTLYVGANYLTNAQRTDFWLNSAPSSAPGSQDLFSIIGISNVDTQATNLTAYAGGAQFQYFNSAGSFINLHSLTAADVDQWWTVTISLTNIDADNTMQTFTVSNGTDTYSAFEIVNSPGAADVIVNTAWLQAYNFAGNAIVGGSLTQNDYTADWARGIVVVPEPATLAAGAGALGLLGTALVRRRRTKA